MNAITGTFRKTTFASGLLAFATLALAITMGPITADAGKRVALNPAGAKPAALKDALRMADESRAALENISDYNATFSKKEIVGKKMITQTMRLKIRSKPFSVYIKFDRPHSGREVIFVDGQNGGRLLVHGTGIERLFGTLKLKPTSRLVMRENRYPITEIGMARMLEMTIARWERLADNTRVRHFPTATLDKRSVRVIQTTHPRKTRRTPFHMTRLFIDTKTGLPVRVEQYGFPKKKKGNPPLLEQYTYSGLRTNVGLKARDFDHENPGYDY